MNISNLRKERKDPPLREGKRYKRPNQLEVFGYSGSDFIGCLTTEIHIW